MKTIQEIKDLVQEYKENREALMSQRKPEPQTVYFYDNYSDTSHCITSIVKDLHVATLPPEAAVMFDNLLADLTKFSNILDENAEKVNAFNEDIRVRLDFLYDTFEKNLDIPEILLCGALRISKKIIEPDDYQQLIDAYISYGFTHFDIKAKHDIIYYDPNKQHFTTMVEELVGSMSLSFKKKYPTLKNFIQNGGVQTDPRHSSQLFDVMNAKKV